MHFSLEEKKNPQNNERVSKKRYENKWTKIEMFIETSSSGTKKSENVN